MANIIEEAAVKVVPELSGFRASLQRQLRQETSGTGNAVKVRIEADQTAAGINSLRRSINRAVSVATRGSDAAKVRVQAVLDVRSFKRELAKLDNQTVTVNVRYRDTNRPGGGSRSGGSNGGGSPLRDLERTVSGGGGEVVGIGKKIGDFLGKGIGDAIGALPGLGQIGAKLGQALVAAGPEVAIPAAALGAVIVAAISTVVLTGIGSVAAAIGGGGILAGGIVLALKDPVILAQAKATAGAMGKALEGAASVLGPAINDALGIINSAIQRLKPQFTQVFATLKPALDRLAQGAAGFLTNITPGLQSLAQVGGQVLSALGDSLPTLANAFSSFAGSLNSAGPGFTDFITDTVNIVSGLVIALGKMLALASQIYEVFRSIPSVVPKAFAPGIGLDPFGGTGGGLGYGLPKNPNPKKYGSAAEGTEPVTPSNSLQAQFDKYQKDNPADALPTQIATIKQAVEASAQADKTATSAKDAYNKTVQQTAQASKSAARAVTSAADAVRDANHAYKESLLDIKDAQDAVKASVVALADAREQARRELRDSIDTEEGNRIALLKANDALAATAGLSDDSLARREAVLNQKNAQETYTDSVKDGNKLRKEGVEGNPAVVSAKKGEKDAEKALKDAYYNSDQAARNLTHSKQDLRDAEDAYTQTLKDGAKARADAKQEMIDTRKKADELAASLGKFDKPFIAQLSLDEGNFPAQAKDTAAYLQALQDFAAGKSTTYDDALKNAQSQVVPGSITIPRLIHRADGGRIDGVGTGTSDSNLALLSKGEHVWTAKEVDAAGGHSAVESMRGAVLGKYATGGAVKFPTPINVNANNSLIDRVLTKTSELGGAYVNLPKTYTGLLGTPVASLIGGDTGGEGPGGAAKGTKAILLAFGNWAKAHGYTIGENSHFNGGHKVTSGHAKNSLHYTDDAIDINAGAGTSTAEQKKLSLLLDDVKAAGLRSIFMYPGHYNHLHVDDSKNGDLGKRPYKDTNGNQFFKSNLTGGAGSGVKYKNLAETAEATARKAGATNKQLLSLIEAGIVESNLKNLDHGPDGSLGFLQQRYFYGSAAKRMDVPTATKAFIAKAKRIDKSSYGSGELAWRVQQPAKAYRGRYQQHRADAYGVINKSTPGIPAGIFDRGGWLMPGQAAINTSPHPEAILNHDQQKDGAGFGMSDAQMRRLATYIAQASQAQNVELMMDGRVVAKKAQKAVGDLIGFPSGGGF